MSKYPGMPAAATPAESIRIALDLLRKIEASRRGETSPEAMLTLLMLLLVGLGSFGMGLMAMAAVSHPAAALLAATFGQ